MTSSIGPCPRGGEGPPCDRRHRADPQTPGPPASWAPAQLCDPPSGRGPVRPIRPERGVASCGAHAPRRPRREHRLPILPAPGAGGGALPQVLARRRRRCPGDLTVVLAPPPVDDTAELEPVLGFPANGPVEGPPGVRMPGSSPPVPPRSCWSAVPRCWAAGDQRRRGRARRRRGRRPPPRWCPSRGRRPGRGLDHPAARQRHHLRRGEHARRPPETAWNSDGQGAGATLVYTFAQPVDLRTITVLNGYQKVRAGSSGRVDLFALNERVRAFTVVTDAGSATWTLRDARAPQTLTHAFGRTRTVGCGSTPSTPHGSTRTWPCRRSASVRPGARDVTLAGGVHARLRVMPAARPLPATTRAILRLASSIISSPSITAPRAPPASEV